MTQRKQLFEEACKIQLIVSKEDVECYEKIILFKQRLISMVQRLTNDEITYLLFKIGKQPDFRLFVVSAALRTDNRPMRRFFGVQKLRFARREELLSLTGLEPGCVPPFGRPLFDLPLYVDAGIAAGDEIAFTAADHRVSIRMKMADYLAVAKPEAVFSFSRA